MKLTDKHKKAINRMREGDYIFENVITGGARCCIGKAPNGNWGNIHASVLNHLSEHKIVEHSKWVNAAIKIHSLTELGKTITL